MRRLPPVDGEWIDRRKSVEFELDGRRLGGFAGDVVSSALAAAGLRTLGRSFKFHRPRGLLSLANHDVNALFQCGPRLNLRGDVTPLEQGMRLTAVNVRGSLERDRGRLLEAFSGLFPVGFYYKAFHSRRWFPFWERLIRGFAGLGRISADTPRQRTAKAYAFCDVLVVGAGPAGLHAALAAAEAGAQVTLADENARLGGSGHYNAGAGAAQRQRLAAVVQRVQGHPRITVFTSTVAAAWYADHWVPLVEAGRITKMRARALVCAAGAMEQPAVFRNNDLPGVMLGSAAQRLIYRYGVAPGRRAVILAGNDDAWRVAWDLRTHGVDIAAIIELRAAGALGQEATELRLAGVPVYFQHAVSEAVPGRGGVRAVRVVPLNAAGQLAGGTAMRIECDLLIMSTGWAPANQLLLEAGVPMRFDEALSQFLPDSLPPGLYACGRVNGVYDFELRCRDGERSGRLAAAELGCGQARDAEPPPPVVDACRPSHPYPIFHHPRGRNFVDFDEDLQLKDLLNAVQEGFDGVELLKRYSTFGMGPSQGKHSNMNAIRILARARGQTIAQVGRPTTRPFMHPVPLSHLAGRGFQPERRTSLHALHAAAGAQCMAAGSWLRPEYYARPAQGREQCIDAEVRAVRQAAGLIDVGTLGKIELYGADAVTLLERAYTGRYAQMKPGSTRYALMLNEAGVVIDDGVIARLGEQHYYFTTTTGGAASVYRELQRLIVQWNLNVGIVNLTGHFGAINLAGPDARRILAPLTPLDLTAAAFPFLAVRLAPVAGVPARIMRVGFVGELGYEIHAPADQMPALWSALVAAGGDSAVTPFGVEAQRLLRLEKGHLIIGQDSDALSNPYELGAERLLAMDKPFFVGQRTLRVLAARPQRNQLVGFALDPGATASPRESHLILDGDNIAGRVTSVAASPTLSRVIGLALIRPDLAQPERELTIRVDGGVQIAARVCPTPFYDPRNLRQRLEEAA